MDEKEFHMLPSAVTFENNTLCYTGQNCQKIPEVLAKLYGPKVHTLDLSYNDLVDIKGIEHFCNVKEIILDNNQLKDNIVIPFFPQLQTISLNKNKIEDLSLLLRKISINAPNLKYLSLLGNKACTHELTAQENDEKDYQRYRYFVLHHLPNLRFLDSKKVREFERAEAACRGQFMNVIRPNQSNVNSLNEILSTITNIFTPLPKNLRRANDYKGTYGKCQYRYSGKHSEGNRFISNKDL